MARNLTLVSAPLGAAGTFVGDAVALAPGTKSVAVESKFAYGAGGTTTKVYLQTTLDGGATWVDIAQHAFATTAANKLSAVKTDTAVAGGVTPTDGSLADNAILDGVLGDRIRVKYVVAGTYSGASSITVVAVAN